jgi:hypothetical protein
VHQAQLWLLAPPCQPYTRRGLQQDTEDGRAASLLKLLALLPSLQVAPLPFRYGMQSQPAPHGLQAGQRLRRCFWVLRCMSTGERG